MTKRTPYKPSSKKPSPGRQKRIATIKTALPMLATFVLLLVVYVFLLAPEEPANVLKRAVINSSDSSKYTSLRYDGSFGDTNRGIEGEFAGQKAASGDQEFRIRLMNDDADSTLETARIGQTSYIRLSGTENLKTITSSITGVVVPDDEVIAILSEVQNKWIRLDSATSELIGNAIPCANSLPGFRTTKTTVLSEEDYPFIYAAGPISPKDDTEDQIYEATISTKQRTTGSFETQITEVVNCLESNYGKDDFRLREAGPADIAAVKVTILVDPLSSTVKRLTFKQVGTYMMINLRDYNKDISIPTPEGSTDVVEIYGALSRPAKEYLAAKLGIPLAL